MTEGVYIKRDRRCDVKRLHGREMKYVMGRRKDRLVTASNCEVTWM